MLDGGYAGPAHSPGAFLTPPPPEHDAGDLSEMLWHPPPLFLEAEDDHVVYPFTMRCKAKRRRDFVNDSLFLVKLRHGKVARRRSTGTRSRPSIY